MSAEFINGNICATGTHCFHSRSWDQYVIFFLTGQKNITCNLLISTSKFILKNNTFF